MEQLNTNIERLLYGNPKGSKGSETEVQNAIRHVRFLVYNGYIEKVIISTAMAEQKPPF